MTEITQWQDPAARRGIHRFVPGLPEPIRARNGTHVSTTMGSTGDAMGRALEDWLDGLTIARTVDAD